MAQIMYARFDLQIDEANATNSMAFVQLTSLSTGDASALVLFTLDQFDDANPDVYVALINPFRSLESVQKQLSFDLRPALSRSGQDVLVAVPKARVKEVLDLWDAESHQILVGQEIDACEFFTDMCQLSARWWQFSPQKPVPEWPRLKGLIGIVTYSSTHETIDLFTTQLGLVKRLCSDLT